MNNEHEKNYDVISKLQTEITDTLYELTNINCGLTGCFGMDMRPENVKRAKELNRLLNSVLAVFED